MFKTTLQRDHAVVFVALAVATIAGWVYLLTGAGMDASAMHAVADGPANSWTMARIVIVFSMWVVMMGAMMLPSAAPMILLHRLIDRKRFTGGESAVRTGIFVGGYLLVWTGFSVAATAAQWVLHRWGLLSPSMAFDSEPLSASLLLAAGIFQLSPLKDACLHQCRSPVTFLARHWRDNSMGILRMGMHHGLYCAGCCGLLMALLFVGGVMNMLWIAALTIWVLVEKVTPHGRLLARAAGITLIIVAMTTLNLSVTVFGIN